MNKDTISIPIKQLAAYCLDYARLTASSSGLGQKIKTSDINDELLPVSDLLFGEDSNDNFILKLRVRKEEISDDLDNEEKIRIEEENKKIEKEIEISNKIDDISIKLKTQSYTKQLVLQTGFVSFTTKKLKTGFFGQQTEEGEIVSEKDVPLLQVAINLNVDHKREYNEITCELVDGTVKILVEQLNKYLPVKEYDEIFKYVADLESQDANILPIADKMVEDLWSQIVFYLNKQNATDIAEAPDLSRSILNLINKANYFLSEDLELLTKLDEEELSKTSLSAWSSDEDMSIEEQVSDDGSTEIFFPFPYDKYQLKTLGIMKNKAIIVEGPPGTGKSQTIANLLLHLAATGNRVLFASQKDQAVRGVKNKLKGLDIKFLFGYIPERSSRLHSEEDEKDSAANTLISMNQEFQKKALLPDQKTPLRVIDKEKMRFLENIDGQRSAFEISEELRKIDYIKPFAESNISKEIVNEYNEIIENILNEQKLVGEYEESIGKLGHIKKYADFNLTNGLIERYKSLALELRNDEKELSLYQGKLGDFIDSQDKMYQDVDFSDKEEEIKELIKKLLATLKDILPDGKSSWLSSISLNMKIKSLNNNFAKKVYQEIAVDVEKIILSETLTKSSKLSCLQNLINYFDYKIIQSNIDYDKAEVVKLFKNTVSQVSEDQLKEFLKIPNGADNVLEYRSISRNLKSAEEKVSSYLNQKQELLRKNNLQDEILAELNKVIENSSEAVFDDINSHRILSQEFSELSSCLGIPINQIRQEIKELRKYYTKDIVKFVQNRILQKVDELKSQRTTKARLERIARSLTKSKKAYKTFDRLKHDNENFATMSEVLPIWMMSLDDVSRIIPAQANCFDYVIIDEASQCNMAYALPVMLRTKHTIFFGDSLQMRDTNTLFKSNEQLSAIAKKHKVSEHYQIKADEDTVKSVMDIAILSGFKTVVLKNHYRSPRQLIGFSNENFYEKVGKKLDIINDNVVKYKDTDRVLINHVIKPDQSIEISGKSNQSEANYIKQLIKSIREDEKLKDKSIAVLTFFNEQAELLQKECEDFEDVKVSIIEGIQGDERDIVIYSFVITDPNSDKKRYVALTGEGGEIRKGANEGRINVAFSRAREQVHCVTSIPPELWPEKIWIKRYLQYVEQNGSVAYQHEFNEQNFDSKFEEDIYKYLSTTLSPKDYLLQTQVGSCGFKIDQVITNINTGKKLAIECDGPTHFENGDGQVYVVDDYERQGVLESAGWTFYRISYFDFFEDKEKTIKGFSEFIEDYFGDKKQNTRLGIIKQLEDIEVEPVKRELPKYQTNIKNTQPLIKVVQQKLSTQNLSTGENNAVLYSHKDDKYYYGVVNGELAKFDINGHTCDGYYIKKRPQNVEQPIKNIVEQRKYSDFSVGDRGVNQDDFEQYLQNNKTITIRYQSIRKGSANKWRTLELSGYNKIYLFTPSADVGYPIKYRRDRVVDFK